MIEATIKMFGRIDIPVNDAGIRHVAPIQDFADGKWEQVIAINLSAPFYAIEAALAGHEEARPGPHHRYRVDPDLRTGCPAGQSRGNRRGTHFV